MSNNSGSMPSSARIVTTLLVAFFVINSSTLVRKAAGEQEPKAQMPPEFRAPKDAPLRITLFEVDEQKMAKLRLMRLGVRPLGERPDLIYAVVVHSTGKDRAAIQLLAKEPAKRNVVTTVSKNNQLRVVGTFGQASRWMAPVSELRPRKLSPALKEPLPKNLKGPELSQKIQERSSKAAEDNLNSESKIDFYIDLSPAMGSAANGDVGKVTRKGDFYISIFQLNEDFDPIKQLSGFVEATRNLYPLRTR